MRNPELIWGVRLGVPEGTLLTVELLNALSIALRLSGMDPLHTKPQALNTRSLNPYKKPQCKIPKPL